jgi:hypothetical protein
VTSANTRSEPVAHVGAAPLWASVVSVVLAAAFPLAYLILLGIVPWFLPPPPYWVLFAGLVLIVIIPLAGAGFGVWGIVAAARTPARSPRRAAALTVGIIGVALCGIEVLGQVAISAVNYVTG